MLFELAKQLIPVFLGVAGWLITHLFANWRQSVANQSEHRWKLVTTYAEFINTCSQCADRIYQLKRARSPWLGHYGTLPKEYYEAVKEPEGNYYLARSAVDSSWTLLEILEPYKVHGERLLEALDAYEQTNDNVEERERLKRFFNLRKELVNIVHQELVVMWKPIGINDIFNSWIRRQEFKIKNNLKYLKRRLKRTKKSGSDLN